MTNPTDDRTGRDSTTIAPPTAPGESVHSIAMQLRQSIADFGRLVRGDDAFEASKIANRAYQLVTKLASPRPTAAPAPKGEAPSEVQTTLTQDDVLEARKLILKATAAKYLSGKSEDAAVIRTWLLHANGYLLGDIASAPPAAPRVEPEMGSAVASRACEALHAIIRAADAAKEPCGMDPESPAAIRNGAFASIAGMAAQGLGLVRGPSLAATPAPQRDSPPQNPRWPDALEGWRIELHAGGVLVRDPNGMGIVASPGATPMLHALALALLRAADE